MRVRTFLMFKGEAESALALYQAALPALLVTSLTRYSDGPMAGKILSCEARLANHELMLFDSPMVHDFGFTPAVSLFVDFLGPQDFDDALRFLSDGGTLLMPDGKYDFSRRFAWVQDRFGVSWQLNLP